jgi:RimJ/RimL family protein N-acetyltransferase
MGSIWDGELVRLRGVEPDDWEWFMRYDQESADARSAWMLNPPRSAEGYRRWTADQAAAAIADEFRVVFESRADGQVAGSLDTFGCDPRTGSFSYGIGLAGDHHRKGYATEASVFNTASIALHSKLGFTREGRRRRTALFGGEYHDEILFGLTVEELTERHPLIEVRG